MQRRYIPRYTFNAVNEVTDCGNDAERVPGLDGEQEMTGRNGIKWTAHSKDREDKGVTRFLHDTPETGANKTPDDLTTPTYRTGGSQVEPRRTATLSLNS